MPHEIERLLTINDLSEMLGIPVDTLYGWRHRGQALRGTESGDTSATAEPASRPGWTLGWTRGAAS